MNNRKVNQSKVEMLDLETRTLFELFMLVSALEDDDDMSPMEYLEKYDSSIEATCRVLDLLGLVEPIEGRIIDWKPTQRLVRLMLEPSARPLKKATRKYATYAHIALLELLLEAGDANAYDHHREADFACGMLEQLGLLRRDNFGDWIPTHRLAELVVEGCDAKLMASSDHVPTGMFGPQIRRR